MSPSTAKVDLGLKKELYDRVFKTQDYFVYDPFDGESLLGWHRNNTYAEIQPNEQGWLWCETLGLWLGIWEGTIDRETASWLRFYDADGTLVPLPEESAQERAAMETQRAAMETQRAEMEAQKAEAERLRAERFAARLRELGEDPDCI
jgi:hypothetical protein